MDYRLFLVATASLCVSLVYCDRCTTKTERGDAYEKCFSDEGQTATDVFTKYRSQSTSLVEELPYIELLEKHGEKLCGNLTDFKAAVDCSFVISRGCVEHASVRSSLPTPDRMANFMEPLCQHRDHINFHCIKGRILTINGCVADHQDEIAQAFIDNNNPVCKVNEIVMDCVKRGLNPCLCTTSRLFSENYYSDVVPQNCHTTELEEEKVVCDAQEPDKFVYVGYSGAFRFSPLTFWMLSLGILIAGAIV